MKCVLEVLVLGFFCEAIFLLAWANWYFKILEIIVFSRWGDVFLSLVVEIVDMCRSCYHVRFVLGAFGVVVSTTFRNYLREDWTNVKTQIIASREWYVCFNEVVDTWSGKFVTIGSCVFPCKAFCHIWVDGIPNPILKFVQPVLRSTKVCLNPLSIESSIRCESIWKSFFVWLDSVRTIESALLVSTFGFLIKHSL